VGRITWPPSVSRPEAGTARAGYCAAISGGSPWLLLIAVPIFALGVWFGLPSARRRPAFGWLMVLAWIIALFVIATLANSLQFAYTIQ
jgi:membrane protein YdbS with pleckstrin-like domain